MHRNNAAALLLSLSLGLLGHGLGAATLEVGPGKPFDSVAAAVEAADFGDEILVHPRTDGEPYQAVGVLVDKPSLTLRAAREPHEPRVKLSGEGFDHSGVGRTPRAIIEFSPDAHGGLLEGFELFGASNRNNNGAGIRINQANYVQIVDCDVHHNQMGIFSNGNATLKAGRGQVIERTHVHHNGGNRISPGPGHNLYLAGHSVRLRFCQIDHSITGHNLKSRAHKLRLEYSYLHDAKHRELDLVDAADTEPAGSDVVLLGNIIVKAREGVGNRSVIHFGQDVKRRRNGRLFLIHNSIQTPYRQPVIDLSSEGTSAYLSGNIFDDGGHKRDGQRLGRGNRGGASAKRITGSHNWFAPGFALGLTETGLTPEGNTIANRSRELFASPEQHDYRLRKPWPDLVGKGASPSLLPQEVKEGGSLQAPLEWQYQHPQGGKPRLPSDTPDLGALSWR